MPALLGLGLGPSCARILSPLIALNAWTLIIEGWMFLTRVPHLTSLPQDKLKSTTSRAEFDAMIPPNIRWKADNYNSLLDQPTQFYAVLIAFALLGGYTETDVKIAWTYVALRVIHSLIHVTVNVIPMRFGIFLTSSVTLLGLTLRAANVAYKSAK